MRLFALRPSWSVVVFAALTGCIEYDLGRDEDPVVDVDTDVDSESPKPDGYGDSLCADHTFDKVEVGVGDVCEFGIGDFHPTVEWEGGKGKNSTALPVVADLDGDGRPEVLVNETAGISPSAKGDLAVYHGDGTKAFTIDAKMGYGAPVAVGDLDDDGSPEIVTVREYQNSMTAKGSYSVITYDHAGAKLWESAKFVGDDFDYATAPTIADMEGDGDPEVIVGRVILRGIDGGTRGVGEFGRGSYGSVSFGGMTMDESAVSSVADIDLDGVMEVIVGDAMYGPDGETLWHDKKQDDAMIGIANLDGDPEGEWIAVSYDSVRAVDTDGTVLWGPKKIDGANIVSPPAIGDLDQDGSPEVIAAGGNFLVCWGADGREKWRVPVTDESGATGASIFDFEGDGWPEVVYIDEIEMMAVDGRTGAVKFLSDEHASATMMDYPVVADVDADGHAEIVVAHQGYGVAFSVYGDRDDSWAPARRLWNQHGYAIANIHDDLSVPAGEAAPYTLYNSWHSGMDHAGTALEDDLEGEILEVCLDDCDAGQVAVAARVINRSDRELPPGIPVTLYAIAKKKQVVGTSTTSEPIPSGWTGETLGFLVDADLARRATRFLLVVDDGGTGSGILAECSETNNEFAEDGPFCP